MKPAKQSIETEYLGLTLRATVVFGDTEGDYSIPHGLNELPPYASSIELLSATDDDWWDNLDKRTQLDLTSHAVEMAAELLACDW